jgi:8-oxo-dGTP pyrophosphatase MutT (NUDIX family)
VVVVLTPRDAATVMLVRDAATTDAGIEVFMLRRHQQSVFLGGAYVFPGGAVEEADRQADAEAVCEGRTDREASEVLGIAGGGLAFWVAAVRECFEEAGVLLAYEAGSRDVMRLDAPDVADRFAAHRRAVHQGERRLVDVCQAEGLRLAVDGMHYVSHWVTPEGAPRRYDTRFFVAAAPPEQEATQDERETVARAWLRPEDALDRHAAGSLAMMLPTVESVRLLTGYRRTADLLAAVPAATTADEAAVPR